MRSVFIDTGYHVAVVDRHDGLNGRALAVGEDLIGERVRLVTSEPILAEFLTFMSKAGAEGRALALAYIDKLFANGTIVVIPATTRLFLQAVALYRGRLDKQYSWTDCSSMVICREEGITEVLSADRDFVQEGFTILL